MANSVWAIVMPAGIDFLRDGVWLGGGALGPVDRSKVLSYDLHSGTLMYSCDSEHTLVNVGRAEHEARSLLPQENKGGYAEPG